MTVHWWWRLLLSTAVLQPTWLDVATAIMGGGLFSKCPSCCMRTRASSIVLEVFSSHTHFNFLLWWPPPSSRLQFNISSGGVEQYAHL